LYCVLGIARRAQPPLGLGGQRPVVDPDDLRKGIGITRLESCDQIPVIVSIKGLWLHDHLSGSSCLPRSTIVLFPPVGHSAWTDQPRR
jgi:hypothetical protein